MAREVRERLRCDFCGKDRNVTTYTITTPGKTVVVDLCRTDGEPFERALKMGDTGPRRSPSRNPDRQSHAVIPID